MRLVIGPAKRQEYQSFAKRFEKDAHICSLIGDLDSYLSGSAFQESVKRWVQILCPTEVIVARSSRDVSSSRYLEMSRKSREMLMQAGISNVSETLYSFRDQVPERPVTVSIDCVDGRLNGNLLNGAGGGYIVRLPGGLATFTQVDPIAASEIELIGTLNAVRVVGRNHQDCKWYAHHGHRPSSSDEDYSYHRGEIGRVTEFFRQKGIPFAGNIHRL